MSWQLAAGMAMGNSDDKKRIAELEEALTKALRMLRQVSHQTWNLSNEAQHVVNAVVAVLPKEQVPSSDKTR